MTGAATRGRTGAPREPVTEEREQLGGPGPGRRGSGTWPAGPERLGNLERGMLDSVMPAAPTRIRSGMRPDVCGQQLGGAARERVHIVVLGHMVTPVPGRLDGLGDAHGASQRAGSVLAVLDPDKNRAPRADVFPGFHSSPTTMPGAPRSVPGVWPAVRSGAAVPRPLPRRDLRGCAPAGPTSRIPGP
jgi:hypothetical protein